MPVSPNDDARRVIPRSHVMRRIVLLLCLASVAAPLAAAPAPLTRRERESPARVRQRLLAERKAQLEALGVRWRLADLGDNSQQGLLIFNRDDRNNAFQLSGVVP